MTLTAEWITWARLACLNGIRSACQLAPWVVSLALVGHKSASALAAVSLMEVFLNSFMEITWRSVGPSLSTLVSQSISQGSLTVLRGWLCLSCLAMLLLSTINAALCVGADKILVSFGADEALAREGRAYALYIIPTVFLKGISICIGTYIVSLQLVSTAVVVDLLSLALNIFFAYAMIAGIPTLDRLKIHNSVQAAAVAWDLGSLLSLIVAVMACYWSVWGRERTCMFSPPPQSPSRLSDKNTNANTNTNTALDFHYSNIHSGLIEEGDFEAEEDAGASMDPNELNEGDSHDKVTKKNARTYCICLMIFTSLYRFLFIPLLIHGKYI